jgi:hypothetical protein
VTFTGAIYGAGLKTQQEWKAVSEALSLSSYLIQPANLLFSFHFHFHSLGRITHHTA